jgi:hypothetical protein
MAARGEGEEKRELLEPRHSLDQRRERAVHALLQPRPDITRLGRSSVLDEASVVCIFKIVECQITLFWYRYVEYAGKVTMLTARNHDLGF